MSQPVATVAAIITDSSADRLRILLTRRAVDPFKGQWCLPGGGITKFEEAREAVRREVREETSIDFEPKFFRYFDEVMHDRDHHHVLIVFAGETSATPNDKSDEVVEVKWFSPDDALKCDLAFNNRNVLQAYLTARTDGSALPGLLAEYAALRGEVSRRIGVRWQIEAFTILFSTGFLGISLSAKVHELLLLLVPCFVALLALIWAHNNLRIGQIGRYIETTIEPRCQGLRWEQALRALALGEQKYVRIRRRVFACAVFLSALLFPLLIAYMEGRLEPSISSLLVVAAYVAACPLILRVIAFGRREHEGLPAGLTPGHKITRL